jgi:hypothetical protein
VAPLDAAQDPQGRDDQERPITDTVKPACRR